MHSLVSVAGREVLRCKESPSGRSLVLDSWWGGHILNMLQVYFLHPEELRTYCTARVQGWKKISKELYKTWISTRTKSVLYLQFSKSLALEVLYPMHKCLSLNHRHTLNLCNKWSHACISAQKHVIWNTTLQSAACAYRPAHFTVTGLEEFHSVFEVKWLQTHCTQCSVVILMWALSTSESLTPCSA